MAADSVAAKRLTAMRLGSVRTPTRSSAKVNTHEQIPLTPEGVFFEADFSGFESRSHPWDKDDETMGNNNQNNNTVMETSHGSRLNEFKTSSFTSQLDGQYVCIYT